jgi:hypothetical protein
MDNIIAIAGIIIVIGLVSVLLGSFLTFDQLIRLEHNSYESQWENDGKPRGFFWFPREYWKSKSTGWFSTWKFQYKSDWAMQRANLIWLFSTSQWIKDNEQAKKLLKRVRVLVLIWNCTFLLAFISIMIIGTLR